MIPWLVSGLSLVGVLLNIHKQVAAFWIWSCTNAYWAFTDFTHGLPAQGVLMTTYCALSIYGIRRWSRKEGGRIDGETNP